MQNLNKITKILGATFILAGSCNVLAETLNSTATTTVQNAFTLTETTALDFGTLRAVAQADGANIAILVLAPDGTSAVTPDGNAALTVLTPGSAGVISVTGAAPFTDLTVGFPADFTLTAAGAPPLSPIFDILQADWRGTIVGGANDGVALNGTFDNLQTDNAGAVSLNIGTSLKTDTAVTTSGYIDAAYTGNYVLTVNY